ncbi:MAG TPA: BON domain-containing protein [Polyangia bacterium]
MMISRTTVLAGTLLISGAWFAGSRTRAEAETTREAKVEAQKDRIDNQAKKQKNQIDDQAKADKDRVDIQAQADKARVDVSAEQKKAAVERGEKPSTAAVEPGKTTASDTAKDTSKKDGVGDEVSDTWITTKVKTSFAGDKKLKGSDIHVDTDHNGVVVLSGFVKNDVARAHAVAVARDTKGVREVKDELRLKADR